MFWLTNADGRNGFRTGIGSGGGWVARFRSLLAFVLPGFFDASLWRFTLRTPIPTENTGVGMAAAEFKASGGSWRAGFTRSHCGA